MGGLLVIGTEGAVVGITSESVSVDGAGRDYTVDRRGASKCDFIGPSSVTSFSSFFKHLPLTHIDVWAEY